jgi:hypothetical protein
MFPVDQVALIVFLVGVVFAVWIAIAFGVALCRGAATERTGQSGARDRLNAA